MNTPIETPALNLVKENQGKTQFLHDFLEFLGERGIGLGEEVEDPNTDRLWTRPIHGATLDDFMYEFIGTTAKDVERERLMILEAMQP